MPKYTLTILLNQVNGTKLEIQQRKPSGRSFKAKLQDREEEFKLVQHAHCNYPTLFIPKVGCAKPLLELPHRFTICSDLKVNHIKTVVMRHLLVVPTSLEVRSL